MQELFDRLLSHPQTIISLFSADPLFWVPDLIYVADIVIRVGLSLRIIGRRRPPSVTMAWLMVVLILPFVGALIYLLIGENRLGEKRARRATAIHDYYHRWQASLRERAGEVDWSERLAELKPLSRQVQNVVGFPILSGNDLLLLTDYPSIFESLIADINAARESCHLQFYIWFEGGLVDEVVAALIRAEQRGVSCRIMADAVGSKLFLRGNKAAELRRAGVEIITLLPVSLFRMLYRRIDLRNHRKIVVIDHEIAYTGSQNMVDPRYFKQGRGVGQWIDVMIRMQGPAVEAMSGTFFEDWHIETGKGREVIEQSSGTLLPAEQGEIPVQVVPSGPAFRPQAIHQLLLTMLYSARRELTITTPYFVPDESIKMALLSAAQRGVAVTIIVPASVDSMLVRHASRAVFDELLVAGVAIAQFHGGLLHTKSIVVDEEFCSVGSVNLDMRSFWLNFEISLFVYDAEFTADFRSLNAGYLERSELLDLDAWLTYPTRHRFLENVTRLLGPLL
jgi:cardiolipin synthase A/B